MNNGFILLSRSLLDSDVFASQKLLKIWIWCLCKANYKDRSVPLKVGKGETIVRVKRGSFLFGRHKAEEELFIDGSTIYKSIHKLQDLEMIEIKSNNQYSVITVCNYNTYQDPESYEVTTKEQPSNNQVTSKEQPSNTTKKDNTDNKYNKDTSTKVDTSFDFDNYIQVINKTFGKKHRVVTPKLKRQIKALLKTELTKEDIMTAIENCKKSEFHKRENYRHCTPEFFSRIDKVDYWSDVKEEKKQKINL